MPVPSVALLLAAHNSEAVHTYRWSGVPRVPTDHEDQGMMAAFLLTGPDQPFRESD